MKKQVTEQTEANIENDSYRQGKDLMITDQSFLFIKID